MSGNQLAFSLSDRKQWAFEHDFCGVALFLMCTRIPALERDFALDVFNRLHVMEMKPSFAEAAAGHSQEPGLALQDGQDGAWAARTSMRTIYRR